MEIPANLQGILENLPQKPGCYIYKNSSGTVIYVGKAINLRNRVRSYFQNENRLDFKTRQLVKHICHIEWIVVGSELEALILEMNLIKRYRPQYNIRLKDDKRYPYIKVHWAAPFPKLTITRLMADDGSRYFGPYTSVWAVHQTLDVLRRIFPYLTCDREITGLDKRACLYHDIKLCTAPCIGAIDQAAYRIMINDLCEFLHGRTDPIVNRLRKEMMTASKEMNFERAAIVRDQIQAIEKVVEKQKVICSDQVDSDVIAMARADGEACVQIFFIRSGKLIGREYFILEGTEEANDSEVVSQFLKQFYVEAATVPTQVLLPEEIEEHRIIEEWLNTRRGGEKVRIMIPATGQGKDLVEMAASNAVETLTSLRNQWQADTNKQTEALTELQQAFQMEEPPNRIECFDISNTQGTNSVASMVVFEQGVPNKKMYRRFNIQTVEGPDDFASMEEALTRRFKRWLAYQEQTDIGKKRDDSFGRLPDLLIVDGGKGQLSRAVRVVDELGLTGMFRLAGLAKQEEELFLPHQFAPIILPRHSQGLYLVQRVRDEAHRFAITAHRARRTKEGLASRLDKVKGIGPAKRKALLKQFGSIENILAASDEQLAAVPGINTEVISSIRSTLT
ncbi:MAG: excinuclease ABC subunit UvrC [Leptolinea sp.]|nr:excinuclease ABC subunit UvrC [Leptolinea sp.]